jgi:hypothetical protein
MKEYKVQHLTTFTSWEDINEITDFTAPWSKLEVPKTTFNAYILNGSIYFRFKAYGPRPLIYIASNHKLEVRYSERVEIFFRSSEEMCPYYCLEMDPHSRVLDYKANFYRHFDREWQWPEALNIKTAIEDGFYTLEGEVSLAVLRKLNLIHDSQIQIGLYRGHCTQLQHDKAEINWISWVDPKVVQADFHIPSSFGLFNI